MKKSDGLGIGDWGLGIGDWGLGQSPIPILLHILKVLLFKLITKGTWRLMEIRLSWMLHS
jgi:hypothetical protein